MIEYENILDNLHWLVEEKILKISGNFRNVTFDIHKSDNEKINELFVIYEDTTKIDKNRDLLFIYNLKIGLLKFLFEETKFYSDNNNDSMLFQLFKSNVLFIKEQLLEFEFISDLNKCYFDNIFVPQSQQEKYEILSKVQLWYSYNCTLIVEDLVLSSEFPKIAKQEITKFLKHKIINLKDKISKEQNFLDWHLVVKNKYLNEISEIEHTLIEVENISLNGNNPPPKILDFEKSIFRSLDARNWFYEAIDDFKEKNPDKRGFNAYCNAIFKNTKCKSLIFVERIKLRSYILFLNDKFNAQFKSLSNLSDPTNYINDVEKLICIYNMNISE